MSLSRKLILVIGATGAQGIAIIDYLLKEPTPYAVRALTRDPTSERAKELEKKGAELFQGRFDDFACVKEALDGYWGVWVNTDGFTIYVGITDPLRVLLGLFLKDRGRLAVGGGRAQTDGPRTTPHLARAPVVGAADDGLGAGSRLPARVLLPLFAVRAQPVTGVGFSIHRMLIARVRALAGDCRLLAYVVPS
ncbi:NAD(P)-binding protein [Fistulina hepatica ATCC 64428]|uniref:NAD(P)-binding protein n=1 Tax=Fistulina hepatica ATCC 64428 TaxID=1128425 RepID=A0A0D7AE42_9AGAR|nr:NAD(P)-binding protein [Fistulina hepatica ATCC 64428]